MTCVGQQFAAVPGCSFWRQCCVSHLQHAHKLARARGISTHGMHPQQEARNAKAQPGRMFAMRQVHTHSQH